MVEKEIEGLFFLFEHDRGRLLSWCPGTSLVPLENELGEGRIEGRILKEA